MRDIILLAADWLPNNYFLFQFLAELKSELSVS